MRIRRQMICAACKKTMKSRLWCKRCRVYLCHNCTDDSKCPKCSGKTSDRYSRYYFGAIFLAVMLFLPLGFYMPLDLEDQALRDMEVTDISDADIGDRVKVMGTIDPSRDITIAGNLTDVDGREKWVWQPNNFYIQDDNGTIWVVAYDLVGCIGEGRIRNSQHPDRQYRGGDTVYVIGTVENLDNRGMSIRPEFISTDSEDFGSYDGMLFYILLPVIAIAFFFALIFRLIIGNHGKLHIENSDSVFPVEDIVSGSWEIQKKDGWEDFDYKTRLRLGLGVLTIVALLPILVYLFWIIDNIHETWFAQWWYVGAVIVFILVAFVYTIAVLGIRRMRGLSTLKYEIKGKNLHIDDIEGFMDDVVLDLNLEYEKFKKEFFTNSWWRLWYDMKSKGGKVIIDLFRHIDHFNVSIIVRPGKVRYVSYQETLKTCVEQAFDGYFSNGDETVPSTPPQETNHTYLKQEEI